MSQNYESHTVNSPISNTSVFQTNDITIALFDVSTYIFVDVSTFRCDARIHYPANGSISFLRNVETVSFNVSWKLHIPMSSFVYQTIWRHFPQDSNLHSYRLYNLNSHTWMACLLLLLLLLLLQSLNLF